jgi:lipoate-protein ligase B
MENPPENALENAPDDTPDSAPASASALKAAERVLAGRALARLHPWGLQSYGDVLALQERLREARQRDAIPDTWLAGEHLAVITQGVRGQQQDLVGSPALPVFKIDRGGMTTLHNPGQLVIYPIVRTQGGILAQARFSLTLLAAVRDWLAGLYGIQLEIQKGRPGLFHGPRKVAAIGISIHGRVSMHGIAINLCNDLSPWRAIIPCGEPSTLPITLSEIAGRNIAPADLIPLLPAWLRWYWGYETVQIAEEPEALV